MKITKTQLKKMIQETVSQSISESKPKSRFKIGDRVKDAWENGSRAGEIERGPEWDDYGEVYKWHVRQDDNGKLGWWNEGGNWEKLNESFSADDVDSFNTELAKLAKKLKGDLDLAKFSQASRGTGSKKFRRQFYIKFTADTKPTDLWLQNGYAQLGVLYGGPKIVIKYEDKTPQQVAEKIKKGLLTIQQSHLGNQDLSESQAGASVDDLAHKATSAAWDKIDVNDPNGDLYYSVKDQIKDILSAQADKELDLK